MWTLGNMRFEGVRGFTAFTSNIEANYVQHPTLNDRPRLQRLGTNLETIDVELYLHIGLGTTPESELAKLYASMEAATREPLSNAEGVFFGYFVVAAVNVTTERADNRGNLVSANVAVTLLEALNPTDQTTSRAVSLAVGSRPKPGQFIRPLATAYTDAGAVMNDLQSVSAQAERVNTEIAEAVAIPALVERNFARSASRLADMQVGLQQINSRILNTQSTIYTAAFGMRSQISSVLGAVTVLQNAVDTVDVVAADAANIVLRETLADFQRVSSPVSLLKSIRQ